MNTLKAMKRSPLGRDLYLWLVYRTFPLRAPLRLTWKQLYSQFGAHPDKASDNRTVDGEDRLIFLCTPVITTNCRCYGMMEFGWDLNGTRPRT